MSQTTNELRADVVKLLCDLQEQWLANASGMPSSRRIKTVDDSVPGQQARGPDDYDNEGFALRRCASDLGRLITQIEKAVRHEQAQGGMAVDGCAQRHHGYLFTSQEVDAAMSLLRRERSEIVTESLDEMELCLRTHCDDEVQ